MKKKREAEKKQQQPKKQQISGTQFIKNSIKTMLSKKKKK